MSTTATRQRHHQDAWKRSTHFNTSGSTQLNRHHIPSIPQSPRRQHHESTQGMTAAFPILHPAIRFTASRTQGSCSSSAKLTDNLSHIEGHGIRPSPHPRLASNHVFTFVIPASSSSFPVKAQETLVGNAHARFQYHR